MVFCIYGPLSSCSYGAHLLGSFVLSIATDPSPECEMALCFSLAVIWDDFFFILAAFHYPRAGLMMRNTVRLFGYKLMARKMSWNWIFNPAPSCPAVYIFLLLSSFIYREDGGICCCVALCSFQSADELIHSLCFIIFSTTSPIRKKKYKNLLAQVFISLEYDFK